MPVVHCKREHYDIYIGRGSKWGNRFTHKKTKVKGTIHVANRELAIHFHKAALWSGILYGRITLDQLATLHGKTLGCWCAPYHDCHGYTLEQIGDWAHLLLTARPFEGVST